MRFSSWSRNTGQALYPLKDTLGCMGVSPTSLHVFCGCGEGIQPCPLECPVLQEYEILGPLLRAIESLYNRCKSLAA